MFKSTGAATPDECRYASGREGDWFPIGLASEQRYISLYVMAAGA